MAIQTRMQALQWGRMVFAGGTHKVPTNMSKQGVVDLHKVLVQRMQAPKHSRPVFDDEAKTFTMTCRCCGNNI